MSVGLTLAAQIVADSTRLGNAWFMAFGPVIIFLTVLFWVGMTLGASRIRPRSYARLPAPPDRGPVKGGIIEGSPSQLNRRDPMLSPAEREALARAEAERAERERAEAEARAARERRRAPRSHRKSRGRRRFGLPRIR